MHSTLPASTISAQAAEGNPTRIPEPLAAALALEGDHFSPRYYRTLAEQSLDITSVLDVTGGIRFESASIEHWTGWSPAELVGQCAFDFVHEEDVPHVMARFAAGLVRGGSTDRVEYRFRHKNGTWRFFESWAKNLLGDPFVSGVVVSTRDITERKDEEARRSATVHLVARLNETGSTREAGIAVADALEQLIGWEEFSFYARQPGRTAVESVISLVHLSGKRREAHGQTVITRAIAGGLRLDQPGHHGGASVVPITGPGGLLGTIVFTELKLPPTRADEAAILQEITTYCGAALQRIYSRVEMAENEARIRMLVDRLPVSVLIHQQGKVIFANPATADLLRLKRPEDVIGLDISSMVLPEYRTVVQQRIGRALAGGNSPWMEMPIRRPDGTIAYVQVCSIGINSGGNPAVQVIFLDITERKRAEQRRSIQYRAARILAQAPTSTALEQFLDAVREGLNLEVAEFWKVEAVSGSLRLAAAAHKPGDALARFVDDGKVRHFRRGDGLPGLVWDKDDVCFSSNVCCDSVFTRSATAADADLQGGIGFPIRIQDALVGVVTLFSRDPGELDNESIELFIALGAQLGQFLERKEIHEQLLQVQKMEAVGQLAGGVAHDFNNLLTVITGRAQLALLHPDVSPTLAEDLKEISATVSRASNLTRQLLTFSRKQVIQKRTLRIESVINELAKMLRRVIGEHITLSLEHEGRLPLIDGDVGMIEQVLVNLAVNARDAMPNGGELQVHTKRISIAEEASAGKPDVRHGTFIVVEVRDTGTGIAPEILPRIFEPFFTTKAVGRGTGLGLATVYGIMKQHNGWIDVESSVGVGTNFRLFFPAVEVPAPAAPVQAPARPPQPGANQTILLIEDEGSLRLLARRVLERNGYKVIEADSGRRALELWETHREDVALVLTDMVMPGGINGREVADRLTQTRADLRVVFTSGYTNELSHEFMNQDHCRFLPKPYNPQQLLGAVAEALGAVPR